MGQTITFIRGSAGVTLTLCYLILSQRPSLSTLHANTSHHTLHHAGHHSVTGSWWISGREFCNLPVCADLLILTPLRIHMRIIGKRKNDSTWAESDKACGEQGGTLASLNTPREWTGVTRLLRDCPHTVDTFLGLRRASPDLHRMYGQSYRWSDGTIAHWLVVVSSSRHVGHQDARRSSVPKVFVFSKQNMGRTWHDYLPLTPLPQDSRRPYLCEVPYPESYFGGKKNNTATTTNSSSSNISSVGTAAEGRLLLLLLLLPHTPDLNLPSLPLMLLLPHSNSSILVLRFISDEIFAPTWTDSSSAAARTSARAAEQVHVRQNKCTCSNVTALAETNVDNTRPVAYISSTLDMA